MANQLFQEVVDVLSPISTRDAAQDAVRTAHEDARCECGHSRGQHDDPVSGDTRCLVVDERSSLGQVFDDGREGDLAYCGCLRFVDARQLTVEHAEHSLLARQSDGSVIGLCKRGGVWLNPLSSPGERELPSQGDEAERADSWVDTRPEQEREDDHALRSADPDRGQQREDLDFGLER